MLSLPSNLASRNKAQSQNDAHVLAFPVVSLHDSMSWTSAQTSICNGGRHGSSYFITIYDDKYGKFGCSKPDPDKFRPGAYEDCLNRGTSVFRRWEATDKPLQWEDSVAAVVWVLYGVSPVNHKDGEAFALTGHPDHVASGTATIALPALEEVVDVLLRDYRCTSPASIRVIYEHAISCSDTMKPR